MKVFIGSLVRMNDGRKATRGVLLPTDDGPRPRRGAFVHSGKKW
jgi:hypothetical protein